MSESPNTCRFCGCTKLAACVLNWDGRTIGCWWVNRERDVCSAPLCVKSYYAELQEKMAILIDLATSPERVA